MLFTVQATFPTGITTLSAPDEDGNFTGLLVRLVVTRGNPREIWGNSVKLKVTYGNVGNWGKSGATWGYLRKTVR